MLLLLLAIAIPANLVGIAAVVYGIVGRGRTIATALAILALLAATVTTALAVFEVATVRKNAESALFQAAAEDVEQINRTTVEDSTTIALWGTGVSVVPWLGMILCFVKARRAED